MSDSNGHGATQGFQEFPFTFANETHRVFYRGAGPAVVIMHEVPGLSPECLDFGSRLAKKNFQVFLPLMFGEPGDHNWLGSALRLCLAKEFHAFESNSSQPITQWMRALCADVQWRTQCAGIGIVGLCLTGGLVMAMISHPAVAAGVASEPAIPIPLTDGGGSQLGISNQELADAKARVAAEHLPILGLRFSNDWICPKTRFDRLQAEFGDAFTPITIDSSPGNAAGITAHAHAVLTNDYKDIDGHPTRLAFERVAAYLRSRLTSVSKFAVPAESQAAPGGA